MHPHHVRATRGARGLWQTYSNWRYTILCSALLLTLAAGAVPSTLAFQAPFLELCLALTLLVAVLPLEDRRTRRLFLAVLVVMVAVQGGTAWGDPIPLAPLTRVLWPVVALLAAACVLRFALGAGCVDRESLSAWLSAYLLAGMFFGVCYWGVEQTWAGALVIPRDSLQLRDAHAAGLWRSGPRERGRASPGHAGGRRGPTVPPRDDRAAGASLRCRGRQGHPTGDVGHPSWLR